MDIIGALMLWKYGLPESINRSGAVHLILEETDNEQVAKAKHYDNMAKIGISLLILGFILQLMGNLFT